MTKVLEYLEEIEKQALKIGNYSGYFEEKAIILRNVRLAKKEIKEEIKEDLDIDE